MHWWLLWPISRSVTVECFWPMIADTPELPYYAVIFSLLCSLEDERGYYSRTANRMLELARRQPGFPGFEPARYGLGISVSCWNSPEAGKTMRNTERHRAMRFAGIKEFGIRICRVEKEHSF